MDRNDGAVHHIDVHPGRPSHAEFLLGSRPVGVANGLQEGSGARRCSGHEPDDEGATSARRYWKPNLLIRSDASCQRSRWAVRGSHFSVQNVRSC